MNIVIKENWHTIIQSYSERLQGRPLEAMARRDQLAFYAGACAVLAAFDPVPTALMDKLGEVSMFPPVVGNISPEPRPKGESEN